jgi:hypothetical protein
MLQGSPLQSKAATHINVHAAQHCHPLAAELPQGLQLRQRHSSSEASRGVACTVRPLILLLLLLPSPLLTAAIAATLRGPVLFKLIIAAVP